MTEQSLNAGWELDDELPPAVTEEADPELQLDLEDLREDLWQPPRTTRHDDEKELMALEARIEDLYYLASDLRQAGGMNQTFAMEAERIMPGFNEVPVGYYTAAPSMTRYKVSMEKLSAGVWAIIAAACAAIIAAIVRAIMWLAGKGGSSSSTPSYSTGGSSATQQQAVRKVHKQQEHAKVQLQAVETTREVVRSLPVQEIAKVIEKVEQDKAPVAAPVTPRPRTLNDLIIKLFDTPGRHQASLDFLELKDPIFRDIAVHGDYSKTMMVALARLDQINALLKEKVALVKQVVATDTGNTTGRRDVLLENKALLSRIDQPMEITLSQGKMTLDEAVKQIGLLREVGGHNNEGDVVPFDVLCQSVTSVYRDSKVQHAYQVMEQSIHHMGELKDQLAQLEKQLSVMTMDGLPGQASQELGSVLRDIVFQIGKEVNAFTRFIYEVEHYIHYLNRASNEVMGIGSEVTRLAAHLYRASGQAVPAAIASALVELRKAMDLSKAASKAIKQ